MFSVGYVKDNIPLKMTMKQGANTAHIQVVSTANADGEPTVAVPAMKGAKVLLKDAIFTINWKGEIVLKMDPFSRLEADEDPDVESFDLFDYQAKHNVGGTVVVHTFRCTDSVLVWDAARRALREQPTSGTPPSARGLHVAAAADESTLIVFGGAAKDGNMCNDAFALDTTSWEWRRLGDGGAERPSPRAGACAAPLPGGGGMIVCCGAESDGGGLVPRADVWALTVDGEWTKLLDDDAPGAPGPRNAATLTPFGDGELLLQGGWRPFVSTYRDSHVLCVER